MTCRRAFETDLAAVLHGESGDADFLAHYPTCAECATEVGVWRELDAMLRAGAPPADDAHPEPETLLAFTDAPATLAADVRAAVERHLAGCRVCADERKALTGFDPTRLPAPPPVPSALAAPSRLARIVWHPAFAYALVAVLLVPLLRSQLGRAPEIRSTEESQREAFAPPPASAPEALSPPAKVEVPIPQADALASRRDARALGAAGNDAAPLAKRAPAPEPDGRRQFAVTVRERERAEDDADSEGAPSLKDLAGEVRQAPAEAARMASDDAPARAKLAQAPAAAPPAAPAESAVSARVFEIRPDAPAVFALPADGEGVRLRIVTPRGLVPGSIDATVRASDATAGASDRTARASDATIRERARAYEIRARVAYRADAIEIDIPPEWLASGDYVVELRNADAAPANGPPPSIRFTIRAPAHP